jgi:thiol:disulfide interchange protein DsbD
MEDNVWSDPKVLKLLNEEYILISLYVDDKSSLPLEEQYVSSFSGKKIKTIGSKWSDFQATYYNSNSQPLYILVDTEGQLLAAPYDYDPDINKYVNFLETGLCRFKKNN